MTSHGILGPLGHGRSKLLFSIDRGFIQLNTACKNKEVKNRGKNGLQQKFKGGENFQVDIQIIVNKKYWKYNYKLVNEKYVSIVLVP